MPQGSKREDREVGAWRDWLFAAIATAALMTVL